VRFFREMEAYASAALSSLGYMLQQERGAGLGQAQAPTNMPSQTNMYQSNYYQQARAQEGAAANRSWNAARAPQQTGVVPRPAYASMFAEVSNDGGLAAGGQAGGGGGMQSLTGEWVGREGFQHNNMQPFFKGNATQNTDVERGMGTLERHTGRSDMFVPKKEVECFFEPTANMGNACGMPVMTSFYESRLVAPITRNNDFPIEREMVGPGLGLGFTAGAAGGRQQANTLDYMRPKNVDELRPANNPKLSFELPMQGPQKGTSKRGLFSVLSKNRPDTFFENTPDKWLKSRGAETKATERPTVLIKPTSRVQTATEYEGTAHAIGQPGKAALVGDDYGKSSICVFDNARTTTTTKTVVSNIRSTIKAIVAPLMDAVRRAPKEYLIDAPRVYGNMSIQIPEKATLVDPVTHQPRTTIKETLIHDTDVSNLHGPTVGPVNTEQEIKTTGRETLPVTDSVRNVASTTYRVRVYNVDEVAKRTHRETMDGAKNIGGNIGRQASHAGAYVTTVVDVPLTQKAFVSATSHFGGAGSKADFRGVSLTATNNALIDGTREMMLAKAGYTPNAKGANINMDADDMNLDIRRINSDSIAPRATPNMTRIKEAGPKQVENCQITKQANELPYSGENRLDPSILSALKSNPYQMNINPIIECK